MREGSVHPPTADIVRPLGQVSFVPFSTKLGRQRHVRFSPDSDQLAYIAQGRFVRSWTFGHSRTIFQILSQSGPNREHGDAEMAYRRRLLFHGITLFLIGLLTGLAEQHFTNVRMALAAHLEGILNGIFLLAVGAIWNEVRLSPQFIMIAFWALLVGTYGNWIVTTTAAILGTAALSPITAGGHSAAPGQEVLVTTGFVLIGLAILFASSLLLWGLRGNVKALQK